MMKYVKDLTAVYLVLVQKINGVLQNTAGENLHGKNMIIITPRALITTITMKIPDVAGIVVPGLKNPSGVIVNTVLQVAALKEKVMRIVV